MKNSTSALQIFWSLLWRATVFAPLFLVFQAIVISSGLGRFFLPVAIGFAAYAGQWERAGVFFAAWIVSVLLWRWKAFRALLEASPSLL
jgi:hypothetical protein